jgi:hypothetical protein
MKFTLDVHLHDVHLHVHLPRDKRNGDTAIMAKFDDVTALLEALNNTTNTLAANVATVIAKEDQQLAEIAVLKEQIAAGTPARR